MVVAAMLRLHQVQYTYMLLACRHVCRHGCVYQVGTVQVDAIQLVDGMNFCGGVATWLWVKQLISNFIGDYNHDRENNG